MRVLGNGIPTCRTYVYYATYLIRSSLVINQSRLGITSSFMFKMKFSAGTDAKEEIEQLTGAET